MEVPTKVYVTCQIADLKQVTGTLMSVSQSGYYEVHIPFGSNTHVVYLPIAATTLTVIEPVLSPPPSFEVER